MASLGWAVLWCASGRGLGASFVSVGDWGGASLSAQDSSNVHAVASGMAQVASSAAFVVNTGDNFYWCGITSTGDGQVSTDWVEPFSGLGLTWYNTLGNHEYGYDVDAQLALNETHSSWVMDGRYYARRVAIGSTFVQFIFLDTSPCVEAYRSDAQSGWDPCGEEYPTCSLSSGDDDFEGPCQFHENILSQDCSAQYAWLEAQLEAVDADDWLVVVGHHPADEIDVLDFASLIQAHGFDLYLNGHTHTLSQYTIDGGGAYVTTGAGSLVDTADQDAPPTALKAAGGNLLAANGHTYETVFNQKVAGFTLHTFSDDYTQLTTDYYDYNANVVHSFTVAKGGTIIQDDDDDASASCCHYDDASCDEGDVCCYSDCDDPDSCSYSESGCSGEYGQIHSCYWDGDACVVGSAAASPPTLPAASLA